MPPVITPEKQREFIMEQCMGALDDAVPHVGKVLFFMNPEAGGGRVTYATNAPRDIAFAAVSAWVDNQKLRRPAPAAVEGPTLTPERAAFEAMVRAGVKLGPGHEGHGQTQKMAILATVASAVAEAVLAAAAP